jgi:CMP/dCMP kinase
MLRMLITIDGPAGVGKSTVSRVLANRLGYAYLDTGALYRALAWKIHQQHVDPDDPERLEMVLSQTDMKVSCHNNELDLMIDGRPIDPQELRTPLVSHLSSRIAAIPQVRDWLLPLQRKLGEGDGVVAEGRDMGTRVFPDADVKFFLDADLEVRAERRRQELAQKGQVFSLAEVQREMAARDSRDRTRSTAPLRPADGAVIINTSNQSVEQVLEQMMNVIADQP